MNLCYITSVIVLISLTLSHQFQDTCPSNVQREGAIPFSSHSNRDSIHSLANFIRDKELGKRPFLSHLCKSNSDSCWTEESFFKVEDNAFVSHYRSVLTNLTLVLVKEKTPIISGFYCLATEARTDDGLPHTLEHLIFQGSKKYPYVDALQQLASRGFSSRVNAWTARDHTCYTQKSAGSEAFLSILPIYLDHIFNPILTPQTYMTEVHHINGEGKDAGVVYSEMQAYESRLAYPILKALTEESILRDDNKRSSYAMSTGGTLVNLRNSTSLDKIQAYHDHFYRPENMVIIVTGNIELDDIIEGLKTTEKDLLSEKMMSEETPREEKERRAREIEQLLNIESIPSDLSFVKPFSEENHLPIRETVTRNVSFPSASNTTGHIAIRWKINESIDEIREEEQQKKYALSTLISHAESPLKKALIFGDDPIASSISISTEMKSDGYVDLVMSDVPVEKFEEAIDRFYLVIGKIKKDGEFAKKDQDLIKALVKKSRITRLRITEESFASWMPRPAIQNFLYGQTLQDMFQFGSKEETKQLLQLTPKDWIDMLDVFESPSVIIYAHPNTTMDKINGDIERERLRQQALDLGEDGLAKAKQELQTALDSKNHPTKEVLQSIPIPSMENLKYFDIEPIEDSEFELSKIPYPFKGYNVESSFVRMKITFNMSSLTVEERKWTSIMFATWLLGDVERNPRESFTYDDMVKRRIEHMLNFGIRIGLQGSIGSDQMYLTLETTMDSFEEAWSIVKDYLFHIKFNNEKISQLITTTLKTVPRVKTSLASMTNALKDEVLLKTDSFPYINSLFKQIPFLKELEKKFEKDPHTKEITDAFEEIRKKIVKPENVFVFFATNIELFTEEIGGQKALDLFTNLFPESEFPFEKSNFNDVSMDAMKRLYETVDPNHIPHFSSGSDIVHDDNFGRQYITGVTGSKSCDLKHVSKHNITDLISKDAIAMRVLLNYIGSAHLQKEIRGEGLAYSPYTYISVSDGFLHFKLNRAAHTAKAFAKFKQIMKEFSTSNNDTLWNEGEFEAAKGSEIYGLINSESSVSSTISTVFNGYVLNLNDDTFQQTIIKRTVDLRLDDLKRVAKIYLPMMLDTSKSLTLMGCGDNQVNQVIDDMKEHGLNVEIYDIDKD